MKKKMIIGLGIVFSVTIMASLVLHFGLSDEKEYKMCLETQKISNTFAKVIGDEPTNVCNE